MRQKKKRGVGEESNGYLVRVRGNKRVKERRERRIDWEEEVYDLRGKKGRLGERKDGRKRQKERLRG